MKSSEVKDRKREQKKMIKNKLSALIQSFELDPGKFKKEIKKLSKKLAKKIKKTDQILVQHSSEATETNKSLPGNVIEPGENTQVNYPTAKKAPAVKKTAVTPPSNNTKNTNPKVKTKPITPLKEKK
jgi:hypothetical protein